MRCTLTLCVCLCACSVPRGGLPTGADAGPIDSGVMCPEGFADPDGDGLCDCLIDDNEVCDSVDNDCDGTVDEAASAGQDGDPRLGVDCDGDDDDLCTDSVTTCDGGAVVCDDPQNPEHVEECEDGLIDEDCDGTSNEGCSCNMGMTQPCGPPDEVGICVRGTQTCQPDGTWGEDCDGAVLPTTETCDNMDQDCDGNTDEAVTQPCFNRCGTEGFETCSGGTFGTCNVAPEPPEVCNGADDDCDTNTDEDVANRACSNACGTPGEEMCVGGMYRNCNAPPPPAETCNGVDDDCDGPTDEGNPGGGGNCGSNVGECSFGTETCMGGSLMCVGGQGSVDEECNNLDDDCDMSTDENLTQSCTLCGATGTETCSAGVWMGCDATPPAETCNALDDDCDGTIDEDDVCGADCTVEDVGGGHVYLYCTTSTRPRGTATGVLLVARNYHLVKLEDQAEHGRVWGDRLRAPERPLVDRPRDHDTGGDVQLGMGRRHRRLSRPTPVPTTVGASGEPAMARTTRSACAWLTIGDPGPRRFHERRVGPRSTVPATKPSSAKPATSGSSRAPDRRGRRHGRRPSVGTRPGAVRPSRADRTACTGSG